MPGYIHTYHSMCEENITIGIDSSSTIEDLKEEFQEKRGVPVMNQIIARPLVDKDRFSKDGFEYAYYNPDLRNTLLNYETLEDCKDEEILLLFVIKDVE